MAFDISHNNVAASCWLPAGCILNSGCLFCLICGVFCKIMQTNKGAAPGSLYKVLALCHAAPDSVMLCLAVPTS